MVTETFAELVFGLVYPIGTNADPVAKLLEKYLKQYGYKTEQFRVSEHLRSLKLGIQFDGLSTFSEMKALMDAGNAARSKATSNSILATIAINDIADIRTDGGKRPPVARTRVAHLIRSLKRPEEVKLLRDVYRPGFFLIGIADDDDSQTAYLTKELGLTEDEAKQVLERDQDEDKFYGQRTRGTFYLADVFIDLRDGKYRDQLHRFLELVFGHPFFTPTREEHAMFMAYASAARSAQLGRQVGAAIATPEGDVIAVGMNEVPSPRGGLYWEGDEDDSRDHKRTVDSNFQHRNQIVKSIIKRLDGKLLTARRLSAVLREILKVMEPNLGESGLNKRSREILQSLPNKGATSSEISTSIHDSDLKEITEYGRAVHGEMDALLCCARLGISVRGKHLFVTTFPCHNCTRHIVAAGIRKVYYIEPYPKSKALDLHSDAICFDEKEAAKFGKVPFLPFVGVGPRRYLDLFSLELSSGRRVERKNKRGEPVVIPKARRSPRVPMISLSYLEREDKLLEEHEDVIKALHGKNHGKN